MRFFKSFALLHRRTKSEPSPVVPLITTTPFSVPQTHCLPPGHSYAANVHIFNLETANARLRHISSVLSDELLQVNSQLKKARDELFMELHRSIRQANANQNEIRQLRRTLMHYKRSLSQLTNPTSHGSVVNSPQSYHQALSDPNDTTVVPWARVTLGPRTRDEYLSALQMTLKTRKELRESKKVAKFWKQTAKEHVQHLDVVTPSSSNISSIHEVLSTDRQNAVDALISQRREVRPVRYVPERQITPAMNLYTLVSDPSIIPATSSALHPVTFQSLSGIVPLASQSFKQQLNDATSTHNRLTQHFSAPKMRRRVLRPFGTPAVSQYRLNQTYARDTNLALQKCGTKMLTNHDESRNLTLQAAGVSNPFSSCHSQNSGRYMSTVRRRAMRGCLECTSAPVDRSSACGCDNYEAFSSKPSTTEIAPTSTFATSVRRLAENVGMRSRLPIPASQLLKKSSSASPFARPSTTNIKDICSLPASKCLSKRSPTLLPAPANRQSLVEIAS